MSRKITILFFLLIFPVYLMAQGNIKGKVTDLQTGEPLIGANVLVEGTTSGAATDVNGEYEIRGLPAGTHTLRASYIGYQTVTVSNITVTTGLTTNQDFELPSEGISVGEIQVVAEKPLIQKDNTNAVRTATREDIEAIPVRGVNAIIAGAPGVIEENGTIFIRGGRSDEVGYYLEGTSIRDPLNGGRAVTISPDAIEEIQVQAGGYTAEFGGANAGIIRSQLRTGGSDIHASYEYITDNIGFQSKDDAFSGKKTLGTQWFGYNEQSFILSGPIFDPSYKFFFNLNYLYNRDPNPQPFGGISLGKVVDPVSADSINLLYPAGPVKGFQSNQYSYAGTISLDFKPIKIRLSGTYTQRNQDLGSTQGEPIVDFLNPRYLQRDLQNGSFSVKLTHVVSPSIFYEVSGGYFIQKFEDTDQSLGADFWNYGDSVANAQAGWVWTKSVKDENGTIKDLSPQQRRYVTPSIRNIFGIAFTGYGDIPGNYQVRDRQSFSVNGALTIFAGKEHTLKIGGEYQQYTLRRWTVGGQSSFAQSVNTLMTDDPSKSLQEVRRSVLLTNGVNNYGYDVLGNKTDEGFFYAPHKPVFAGAYIQDKIELEDLVINAGLRFDYIDIDNLQLKDPANPDAGITSSGNELKEEGWTKVPTFSALSPRLGFSFPVTDKTVFHAQFGKFVQQTQLIDVYQGYHRTAFEISGGFFIPSPVGKNVRPTRTTQYELGFTQLLTDFLSFDITGYYRDIKDQVVYVSQPTNSNSSFQAYSTLTNGDFATTKGLEITLDMRRFERVKFGASVSFQDAQGTGSSPNSNRGIVGAPLDGVTVFKPVYISPLEFNEAISGGFNIDYRFGPNDGPSVLHDFGASVAASFASGHPFTRGVGQANLETDARSRQPVEPLNSSTTPATFNVNLRVDKTVNLFDKLSANIYIWVINLFDNRNVENVFLRTGSADDNGVLTNPELSAQTIANYGQDYVDLYSAVNLDYGSEYRIATGNFLFGPPRQIRLGIRLAY